MTLELAELQAGFAQFVATANELERAYAELKARATSIDGELQATNRALQATLTEREAIVAALPIGLVGVRADGVAVCHNAEADRLTALARADGCDLCAHAGGDVAFGDVLVRVRRVPLGSDELILLEDRSRVRELEREVHRLDRLAGLSELALGVAHEIKNPLNGVLGFAALLERSEDPVAMRRFAGKIKDGARQVDEIVRAMLGFARPARARGRLLPVAEIANEAAAAAALPAARVEVRGAADQRADAEALLRVLANLFGNAREVSPSVRVTVDVTVRHGRLEILVTDDGPGVPAAVGNKIFEPFVSTKERGTGLGLPLAARVLSFLGGSLELVNPGEPGACFRVRLPLAETSAEAPVAALQEAAS